MNLSKFDIRILMALRKEGSPMANYLIARRLGKNPAQTYKRLTLMAQNGVLKVIEGYPKFYTFEPNNTAQSFIVMVVECPHCKKLHIRHQSQTTIQCDCQTKSGKQRRFYIFNGRIKSKKVLTKQAEKELVTPPEEPASLPTPSEEMENDVMDIMEESF